MRIPNQAEIDALRNVVRYDAETGKFFWLASHCRSVAVGAEAGSINRGGYRILHYRRRSYLAHRLAIAFATGTWPAAECIDHINCDPGDNRIDNLRECTLSQNQGNRRKRASAASSLKGVTRDKRDGVWRARIRVGGKKIALGSFATAEAAHAAYCQAAVVIFGEFARAN